MSTSGKRLGIVRWRTCSTVATHSGAFASFLISLAPCIGFACGCVLFPDALFKFLQSKCVWEASEYGIMLTVTIDSPEVTRALST